MQRQRAVLPRLLKLKLCRPAPQAQLACSNLDSMLPGVLLLVSICRQQPALLASHVGQLKDCLAAFGALPADAALVLLRALWPLCLVRSDLQDHVVMLLRKLMYRQDVAGRCGCAGLWACLLRWAARAPALHRCTHAARAGACCCRDCSPSASPHAHNRTPPSACCVRRLVAIRGFLCLVLQHLADAAPGGGSGGGLVAGSDPSEAGCSQVGQAAVLPERCRDSQCRRVSHCQRQLLTCNAHPVPVCLAVYFLSACPSAQQASLSQVASLSSAGINLLQELTGVLRRALSQQAPVRQALYAGLQQVCAAARVERIYETVVHCAARCVALLLACVRLSIHNGSDQGAHNEPAACALCLARLLLHAARCWPQTLAHASSWPSCCCRTCGSLWQTGRRSCRPCSFTAAPPSHRCAAVRLASPCGAAAPQRSTTPCDDTPCCVHMPLS